MARQKSIFKIEGTIGGVTFYKTKDGYLAKEKSGVSAEKIRTDPRFARTRENGEEFKTAVQSGKKLRDSVRWFTKTACDKRVSSRLTQVMSRVLKEDNFNFRGMRTPHLGLDTPDGKTLLKLFNFNKNAELKSVLYKPWTLDTITGTIDLGNIDPLNDLFIPSGATHFSISGAVEVLDFSTGIYDFKETNSVNALVGSGTVNVSLAPSTMPSGSGFTLYFLKVEFFQMVNGELYPLRDGAHNSSALIEIL